MPSLEGTDDGAGYAVKGTSPTGSGVVGDGPAWAGVVASSVTGSGVSSFSDSGAGVLTLSNTGAGVEASSVQGTGVAGSSNQGYGVTGDGAIAGVMGTSPGGYGVYGAGTTAHIAAVYGFSGLADGGRGVEGHVSGTDAVAVLGNAATGLGVLGTTTSGRGVEGRALTGIAVLGVVGNDETSLSGTGRAVVGIAGVGTGVDGSSVSGTGVAGASGSATGVVGRSDSGSGMDARSTSGVGIWAESTGYEAVHAVTHSGVTAAVAAYNLNEDGSGAAVFAHKSGPRGHAGFFDGPVHVTGDLTVGGAIELLGGADYAEAMPVAPTATVVEGMVVVIDDDGQIRPCAEDYDSRLAGVVSGAGDVPAAVVLDRQAGGLPVALMGKLWVLADADLGPIRCGDMLTTSASPGHARVVADRSQAFGAVVGKALTPLAAGRGLVRVLVSAS